MLVAAVVVVPVAVDVDVVVVPDVVPDVVVDVVPVVLEEHTDHAGPLKDCPAYCKLLRGGGGANKDALCMGA